MLQKFYGYFAVAGLALFLLAPAVRSQSVSSGGAFLPIDDTVWGGVHTWVGNLSPLVIAGTADDGFETTLTFTQPTGSNVITVFDATDQLVGRATTDSLTNKTLGKGTTRVSYRQDFDGPCMRKELVDFTVEIVTDAGINIAMCDGGITNFVYRLDGAQATPFLALGGALDIDNDGANNEGVEIILSGLEVDDGGWIEVGTTAAYGVRASITIASVSGTDNMYFGWKIAGSFVDDLVLETIDTYGVFHINDAVGNIEIQTGANGTDADDEADVNPVWADAETILLEVRVSTAGVFTFFQDGSAVTITQATGAAEAGDVLVPVLGMLNDTDADTELSVDYFEIFEVI